MAGPKVIISGMCLSHYIPQNSPTYRYKGDIVWAHEVTKQLLGSIAEVVVSQDLFVFKYTVIDADES